MRYKHFIIIALAVVSSSVAAQDTVRLTLDSCLRYASLHSPTVLTAAMQREAAAAALEQAWWNLTPTLQASAGADMAYFQNAKTTNTSYGIGGSWTILDGLSNMNGLRSSMAEQQRSDLAVEKSRNDVAVQIVSTYLEVLANREQQQYLAELYASTRQQADEAEVKYRNGMILESDYLLLKADMARSENNMNNATFSIENGIMRLRHLMGLSDSVVFDVVAIEGDPAEKELPPLEVLLDSAIHHAMPELKMSELELKKARYALSSAKGSYIPQLGLNAYASYYGGDHERTDASGMLVTTGGINTTLSLGLSVPILDRGYRRMQLKQSKVAVQQAELQIQQMSDELRQTVAERYRTLLQARNTMEVCRIMQQATKASLEVYQAKFEAGAVSTTELLQQEERYISAVNDYVQSKYTYIISDLIMQIYLGEK